MKMTKLLCASLLALTSAGMAFASNNPTIKLTGSTAFRKATVFAIVDSLNNPRGGAIGSNTTTFDLSGAPRAVITGTLKSGPSTGATVSFQLAWAGSVGGLEAVAGAGSSTIPGSGFGAGVTWLSDTNALVALTANPGSGTVTGSSSVELGAPVFDGASIPDGANSDTFKGDLSALGFNTSNLLPTTETGQATVGVVQFYWVKGTLNPLLPAAAYNRLTNVTQQQARLLLANASVPLSIFTGVPGDAGFDVLLIGRNNDSGTRFDAEAEPGFGFFQLENQYKASLNGSGQINGVTFVGDVGYPSGGSVANDLKAPFAAGGATDDFAQPFVFVGYIGASDTKTAVGGGAQSLTYNGVSAYNNGGNAVLSDPIYQGAYSFWAYEHTYYRSTTPGLQVNAITLVANTIRSTDYVQSGLSDDPSLNLVTRGLEGAVIAPR